jgi:hypothetical protein
LEDDMITSSVCRRFVAGGVCVFALGAIIGPGAAAFAAPVTLRCTLYEGGSDEFIVQYFAVDAVRQTVFSSGDTYRIAVDPEGGTGRAITNWSETDITLVAEDWVTNGWPRSRIVTVFDRLTGAVWSERNGVPFSGACDVADPARKMF